MQPLSRGNQALSTSILPVASLGKVLETGPDPRKLDCLDMMLSERTSERASRYHFPWGQGTSGVPWAWSLGSSLLQNTGFPEGRNKRARVTEQTGWGDEWSLGLLQSRVYLLLLESPKFKQKSCVPSSLLQTKGPATSPSCLSGTSPPRHTISLASRAP